MFPASTSAVSPESPLLAGSFLSSASEEIQKRVVHDGEGSHRWKRYLWIVVVGQILEFVAYRGGLASISPLP